MRHFCLIAFLLFQSLLAQDKKLDLQDIWLKGTFDIATLEAFRSMKTGDFYTVLNHNSYGTYLDKFDYATLKKIETVVVGKDLPGIRYFDDYDFDRSERKLLLGVDLKPVYRRSKSGKYYVYDLGDKTLQVIADQEIRSPAFSPDGSKVAYVRENNIYVKDLSDGSITQVTFDGKKNEVLNGISDWVYEEEFKLVRAYEWNGNSDMIAFLRFDETEVPEISIDLYGDGLYPGQQVFKYPKAGEANSKVSLHLYDLKSKTTVRATLGELDQHYLPRLQWTHNPYVLVLTSINRLQNNLNLIRVDARENESSLLLNEKDEAYVQIRDDLTFLEDNSFIWTSERDGFNHLYHYGPEGKLKNQITQGPWEVTSYYGYDPVTNRVFYQSTEEGSINRSVYGISLRGSKKKKLSLLTGQNEAAFSKSFRYFVNTHSSESRPTAYTLMDARTGEELQVIKNNDALIEKLEGYSLGEKEFSTLKTENGEFNMYLIKPPDFDPAKKYPLLMFQYSGPGSQSVVNRWKNPKRHDYWHHMLAQEGYVIACVDGRGTGFKGRDFKKVTYGQLGKYELQDQVEAARILGSRPYIDESRIGIWGWSFGGYISSLAITRGAPVFKMAIAVAPVTSWRFYDTVYTERFLKTPQENPSGYDDNSPLSHAELLQGDYLLIHGTGDDNVHVQNSMRMVDALVEVNKQFDYFAYPDRAHGISRGKNTRYHLFQKMTTFIRNSLGSPPNEIQEIKN